MNANTILGCKMKKIKKRTLSPSMTLVLGFALTIFIGACLLNLGIASNDGNNVGFINALFTATTSVCVTGLIVVDTGTHWTQFGQLIILLLIQIGGLGFMAITTMGAVLTGKRINLSYRLNIQESLSQNSLSGIVRLTKSIVFGTFIVEGIGALFLATTFVPQFGWIKGIYFSIFHAVSAFCNAGIDLMGNFQSITSYVTNPVVSLTIAMLIVFGGLGFNVIFDVMKNRKFKRLTLHSKIVLVSTAILIFGGAILFFISEWNNPGTMGPLSYPNKIIASVFQSITPRTAGYNTIDLNSMHSDSKLLTIILMLIGGSPASTAGGIKTTTLAIVIFTIVNYVKGRQELEIYGRRISSESIKKAVSIFTMLIAIFLTGCFLLSSFEPQIDLVSVMFEVASAVGTVGLSLGITPTLGNAGKLLLILIMFAGRVGILTIVFALMQKTHVVKYRLPEEKVIM